tara:strand:+ start:9994 stop:11370 length:1377 start_codon:yes stop_codon:yes gene_type:complete
MQYENQRLLSETLIDPELGGTNNLLAGGKINNLSIDTSLMGLNPVARTFIVKGKPGSKFIIIAIQDGVSKYYNFENDLFELGHTSKNNLKVTMPNSSFYRRTIQFPSGGGDYVIKLLPEKGTVVKNNRKVISINIEKQASENTITFKPATVNTSNYSTLPTVTSTGSASDGASLTSNFLINNASTDAGGFGFKFFGNIPSKLGVDYSFSGDLKREVFDQLWYVQSTKAIVVNTKGDGVFSGEVTAANADGISVGMELFYHKATTTPVDEAGDPLQGVHIVGIEQGLGEVTIFFSQSVAFENGETMTLRAYGSKHIFTNTGVDIIWLDKNVELSAPGLTKTVRANSEGSQTITLEDTHGISGGNTISYSGFDVNNASSNLVNVVTPDCPDLTSAGALDNDGEITVQLAQTLKLGTVLTFKGVHNQFSMNFNVKINNHPGSNTDVLFDLDKIITVGVSGA